MKIIRRLNRFFFPDTSHVQRDQLWIRKESEARHGFDTFDLLFVIFVSNRNGIVQTTCPPKAEQRPAVYQMGPCLFLRELLRDYRQVTEAEASSLGFLL